MLALSLVALFKSVQCDNGREFDNSSHAFFLANGVSLCMSCPYTSPQNGKAERMLCTTYNVTHTLLFQAYMPPVFWADAFANATHIINRLPTKNLHMSTPFFTLYGTLPSYHDLRIFGCTCYPNLTATTAHKLAPRSSLCKFLGYSHDHKGYQCLDLSTNRVIISRHVTFNETTFPFAQHRPTPTSQELDFLLITTLCKVFHSQVLLALGSDMPLPGPLHQDLPHHGPLLAQESWPLGLLLLTQLCRPCSLPH
jgi:hypothetical protein